MHDMRMLREQVAVLREGMRRRGALEALAPTIDRAESLDRERRTAIQAVDERKALRNLNSQEVARRKRAGEDAEELIAGGRSLGIEIGRLEDELRQIEEELNRLVLWIPNVTLAAVPAGGEENNEIVREWGTPRPPDGVRPHWEVAERLGLIDFPRASKISGSGFIVYRGLGARLIRSLMNYFMNLHQDEHGYTEVWPPLLVTRDSLTGTTQLPKVRRRRPLHRTEGDDLFLVPTAEVPVTNLYRDEIIDGADLPMRFVAYSKCFRREAGAAGKDTRGVLRTHEFDKVELVRYAAPETSDEELERLTRHAETALERLGLPYRRKLLAAGDTGFGSAMTYDSRVHGRQASAHG